MKNDNRSEKHRNGLKLNIYNPKRRRRRSGKKTLIVIYFVISVALENFVYCYFCFGYNLSLWLKKEENK